MMSRVLSQRMSVPWVSNIACTRYLSALLTLLILLLSVSLSFADPPPEVSRTFPASLGGFHQIGPVNQIVPGGKENFRPGEDLKESLPVFVAEAEYSAADGERLRVSLTKYENDSIAYSNLTWWRKYQHERAKADVQVDNVGTANSLISTEGLAFFKGPAFVVVTTENGKNLDQVTTFARVFSATLDEGEADIPVLVKHLPSWETEKRDVIYVVNASQLLSAIPNQPILKEINFEGGTEAVGANYGQAQLVIVEFTTPQFSVENDQRIWTKISELKSAGQPGPGAYRRVGNYSVFVFNATDEKTANELIDQVKYEKVVQWLGDDPHLYEKLQRYLTQTSAGVLAAVLKSSGLSLLICVGVGTLFGALLFRRRRAQQAALYSDAGGAVRLNLDEITGASNSQRLLGTGNQPESDSTQS